MAVLIIFIDSHTNLQLKFEMRVHHFLQTGREISLNSEITIDYELHNVSAFFQSKSKRVSRYVYCGGCPWSIKLEVNEKLELCRFFRPGQSNFHSVQYLGIALQCHRDRSEDNPWSINVWYDLILLDPVSGIVMEQHRNPARFQSSEGMINAQFEMSFVSLFSATKLTKSYSPIQLIN